MMEVFPTPRSPMTKTLSRRSCCISKQQQKFGSWICEALTGRLRRQHLILKMEVRVRLINHRSIVPRRAETHCWGVKEKRCYPAVCVYTSHNTAATPTNTAQFQACACPCVDLKLFLIRIRIWSSSLLNNALLLQQNSSWTIFIRRLRDQTNFLSPKLF